MTENILITGNGLLSKELQQNFNDSVYTTFFTNKTNQKNSFFLDVTKKNNLEKIFSEIKMQTVTEVIMSFYKNYNDTKNNQVRL